jgi:hypothetical protein
MWKGDEDILASATYEVMRTGGDIERVISILLGANYEHTYRNTINVNNWLKLWKGADSDLVKVCITIRKMNVNMADLIETLDALEFEHNFKNIRDILVIE